MHFPPVTAHLFTILPTSIKVSHLICSKHVVHIFGQFCLERAHDGKLLANENLCEQLLGTGKQHGLLLEILNVGAFSQELGHVTNLMSGLA